MQSIPLHYYIGFNKPAQAVEVMESFGYQVIAKDRAAVSRTIAQFITKEQEKGLSAMIAIHPDRDIILDHEPKTTLSTLGADGFQDTYKPVVVNTAAPLAPEQPKPTDHTPLIFGGLVACALFLSVAVIIAKKS